MNGWSKNDYKLLLSGPFADERKFNIETLENIFRYPEPTRQTLHSVLSSLNTIMTYYAWALLMLGGIILAACLVLPFPDLLLVLFYGLYCVGGMIFMTAFYRFPPRIGDPIWLMIIGFLMYLMFTRGAYSQRRVIRLGQSFLIGMCCLLWITEMVDLKTYIARDIKEYAAFQADLKKLNTVYPDTIMLWQPLTGLPIEYLNPFTSPPQMKFTLILGGWTTYSPGFYHILERVLNIQHGYELLPCMVDNPHAFFLIGSETWKPSILAYFKETLKVPVIFVRVDDLSHSALYKLMTK
jgi:hypothetical protein